MGQCISYEFKDFKIAYYSCMNEVLYTIFMEFGIPMELVRLMKMCSYEACIHVQIIPPSTLDALLDTSPRLMSYTRGCNYSF